MTDLDVAPKSLLGARQGAENVVGTDDWVLTVHQPEVNAEESVRI